MMLALVLPVVFWSASADSLESQSLETRLKALHSELRHAPDSLKFSLYVALAELQFFNSFRFSNEETDARRAALDQALASAEAALRLNRTTTARTARCAILLERTRLLDNKTAIVTIDSCRRELMEIHKQDSLNDFTHLVLGALGVELAKISPVQRTFAPLFYAPIPTEPALDVSLLWLLQAKFARLYPAFTYLKLGEAYILLRNAKDAIESLNACLRQPEQHPYFDAHCKRLAKQRLDDYLPRIR
jgi:hypothetical protein